MHNRQEEQTTDLEQSINALKEIQASVNRYIPLFRMDVKGTFTYANQAMCTISGYTAEELIGQNYQILQHPDMSTKTIEALLESIKNNKEWEGEIKNRAQDGSAYWTNIHIHPLYNTMHQIIGYQALLENITYKKELEYLASYDALTNIYNRRKFDESITQELIRYQRYKIDFSLILCDVDCFKKVNDKYGHLIGDKVLKKIANVIKDSVRTSDILARWGGEEFAILLPHTSLKESNIAAEKIRANIEKTLFESITKITISCGVTQVKNGDNTATIFQRTDKALYQAKKRGRNCVIVYTEH